MIFVSFKAESYTPTFSVSANANQMLRKLWPTLKVCWLGRSVSGLFQHKGPRSPDTELARPEFGMGLQ